jgi:hypothetical protein
MMNAERRKACMLFFVLHSVLRPGRTPLYFIIVDCASHLRHNASRMARVKQKKQKLTANVGFPFRRLSLDPSWRVLDEALAELEANQDLRLLSPPEYVIGFLLARLGDIQITQSIEVDIARESETASGSPKMRRRSKSKRPKASPSDS